MVNDLVEAVDRIAFNTEFSGAVRVDHGAEVVLAKAYGYANRAYRVPNTIGTRFAIASGTKGISALTVASLIEEGVLDWSTTARSLLGTDLPMVNNDVTVAHLLEHRSGVGDYFDEEDTRSTNDPVLPVPVHELETTEKYLPVLDGWPTKFESGARFSYCNSGYVLLALIAERATRLSFNDLVRQRVCEPAGMRETAFLRSDELPESAALGYLSTGGQRTNVFHLPVLGSGDGGIYTTLADFHLLWSAAFNGLVVSRDVIDELVIPRSDSPTVSKRYGRGFWLHESSSAVTLEGSDAGVSFRSVHDPVSRATHTVVSNVSDGAWPLARHLEAALSSSSR